MQGVANLEEKAMSDIKMKYEVQMYNIAICVLLCLRFNKFYLLLILSNAL